MTCEVRPGASLDTHIDPQNYQEDQYLGSAMSLDVSSTITTRPLRRTVSTWMGMDWSASALASLFPTTKTSD
jgi:hypothetical protein